MQRKIPDDQSSGNSTTVTYYDWVAQANLIVITEDKDEGNPLWDLELGSGQSYYFHPGKDCMPTKFPVGILRKDWLAESEFLGERTFLGKKVLVWTKADFIDYYADAETCDPVSWYFHTMKARFDTIYYAPNATAPPHFFDPPMECFAEIRE